MNAAPDTVVVARSREDDEGLFSRREIDGQLVRVDKPTREQLDKRIRIWIDGQAVQTTVARPRTDAQGNPLQDRDEMQIARQTTIYDAAARLYGESAVRTHIPALCHQPHMNPVAVCRVCSIQVGKVEKAKDGKPYMKLDRRLRPACQTPVTENMHVFTLNAKRMLKEWPRGYLAPVTRKDIEKALEAVRRAVTGLTYLLSDDHLTLAPGAAGLDNDGDNELRKILALHCKEPSPFKSLTLYSTTGNRTAGTLPGRVDDSSPVFSVDHSACILCDRCSRACSDVKDNNVIGRTGKGAHVGIGFDLNVPMGDSSCVQCGECMISCPTSAITFRPVALVKTAIRSDEPKLTTAELSQDALLKDLPSKFLRWQEGLIVRRFVSRGTYLIRQGDPGNTAFIIKSGQFNLKVWPTDGEGRVMRDGPPGGRSKILHLPIFGRNIGKPEGAVKPIEDEYFDRKTPMIGEMSCLTGQARTGDVRAAADGEVWEIRRNVVDRLLRFPEHNEALLKAYRERALNDAMTRLHLFKGLQASDRNACAAFIRLRLKYVRVRRGTIIFSQDELSDDLHVYFIRLGHVRLNIRTPGREERVLWRQPGSLIGEFAQLGIKPQDVNPGEDLRRKRDFTAVVERMDRNLEQVLRSGGEIKASRPSASCTALDDLELARLSSRDFIELVRQFPLVRRQLIETALGRIRDDLYAPRDPAQAAYVEQGFYQGQSLLVIDTMSCTHCDECTKACVEQHLTTPGDTPLARLIREGPRFGDFIVARSCRSCHDAYCMEGCPVDAIHRGRHKQIVIEDHCIGCGLCAQNCPYDNIWMEELKTPSAAAGSVRLSPSVAKLKALTCDLCDSDGLREVPLPRCIHACPHDAAFRMSGEELLKLVTGGRRIRAERRRRKSQE